jgi:hypothetical protein
MGFFHLTFLNRLKNWISLCVRLTQTLVHKIYAYLFNLMPMAIFVIIGMINTLVKQTKSVVTAVRASLQFCHAYVRWFP